MEISPNIFRAYDIRGIVGETLNPDIVKHIGHVLGLMYPDVEKICVGRDGRLSSQNLAAALIEGLKDSGKHIYDVGQVPTPVLYFSTHYLKTRSGIMVTGSHNPSEYNGLKILMNGNTLSGSLIKDIYEEICKRDLIFHSGVLKEIKVGSQYISEITADIKLKRPMRIAIDCGNGVAGPLAAILFKDLGCEVVELYCNVDGNFPNHPPNPNDIENLTDLINCVVENNLDIGFAFDGDGDRCIVVDNDGEVLWPDRQMMLYSVDILSRNPKAKIVFDVKSSRNLEQVIKENGGEPFMHKTGHSFIKSKMKEVGAILGGEMSGHIFFNERWYGFDDGLYTASRMLELVSKQEHASSIFFKQIPSCPCTPEINIPLEKEEQQYSFMKDFSENAQFPDATITDIDGIRADYPYGWGLLRASNTTPSLVARFEADSESQLLNIKKEFKQQILKIDSEIDVPF